MIIINKKFVTALVLLTVFGLLAGPLLMSGGNGRHSGNSNVQSSNTSQSHANMHGNNNVSPENPDPNLFNGEITNQEIEVGSFIGVGSYDRNCVDVGNGLTNCDAGIKTQEYGVLNFNYIHNMMAQSCIKPGDKLKIKILGENGAAIVQRML